MIDQVYLHSDKGLIAIGFTRNTNAIQIGAPKREEKLFEKCFE